MGEPDYSFSLTNFSRSRRLVRIEYAVQARTAGVTALGMKGKLTVDLPLRPEKRKSMLRTNLYLT